MGYTHYFYKKSPLDPQKFLAFQNDVRKLILNNKTDVPLHCDYDSNEQPLVTPDIVRFNGKLDDGHETFLFTRVAEDRDEDFNKNGYRFNFCKTAQKPYDKYVVACLILSKIHFGEDVEISSDGDLCEWEDGVKLIKDNFDFDFKLTISNDNKFIVKVKKSAEEKEHLRVEQLEKKRIEKEQKEMEQIRKEAEESPEGINDIYKKIMGQRKIA